MSTFFVLLLFVGLVKYFWDQNKGNMIVMLVNNVLASKFAAPANGISKAVKQLSGAYHIDYIVGNTTYTIVIPPQKRKVKWDKATAHFENGETVEITELLKPYAGPHGNFMNFDYHPHHLHRNAKKIVVYHEESIVRLFGDSK
jgi:hypothetical protein